MGSQDFPDLCFQVKFAQLDIELLSIGWQIKFLLLTDTTALVHVLALDMDIYRQGVANPRHISLSGIVQSSMQFVVFSNTSRTRKTIKLLQPILRVHAFQYNNIWSINKKVTTYFSTVVLNDALLTNTINIILVSKSMQEYI